MPAGETPVPCIRCNQTVKFGDLSELARGLGAERLATGHYVRRIDGPDGAELHRAADAARDQSWFLFATTRAQLDDVPVSARRDGGQAGGARCRAAAGAGGCREAGQPGHLLRAVGRLYRRGGAASAPTRWSRARSSPRTAASSASHDGIARYTVGQGKRLGDAAVLAGERQMVARNRSRPAPRGHRAARRRAPGRFALREVNWLAEAGGVVSLRGQAARARPVAAGDRAHGVGETRLRRTGRAGTAGAGPGLRVLCREDRVLGGGIIAREAKA